MEPLANLVSSSCMLQLEMEYSVYAGKVTVELPKVASHFVEAHQTDTECGDAPVTEVDKVDSSHGPSCVASCALSLIQAHLANLVAKCRSQCNATALAKVAFKQSNAEAITLQSEVHHPPASPFSRLVSAALTLCPARRGPLLEDDS